MLLLLNIEKNNPDFFGNIYMSYIDTITISKFVRWFYVVFFNHKNLRVHNVSNHRNGYQNQFINDFARKNLAKMKKSRSSVPTWSQSLFLIKIYN